tara:strand:- start:293 stop:742 length:450 start_codon:yes stop_codon:yes gene_type:complete
MSLNWDIKKIKDWEKLKDSETDFFIYATMAVHLNEIKQNNIEEWFYRLYDMHYGTDIGSGFLNEYLAPRQQGYCDYWFHYCSITRQIDSTDKSLGCDTVWKTIIDALDRYVGLKTNVSNWSRAEFNKYTKKERESVVNHNLKVFNKRRK